MHLGESAQIRTEQERSDSAKRRTVSRSKSSLGLPGLRSRVVERLYTSYEAPEGRQKQSELEAIISTLRGGQTNESR
ncbi:hypothetical protein RTBOTA2_006390 [Rhodotorula toruloides]|nr:hypothetical protein RTBOTA2_006390 [Rhodotorula toruloides]